MRRSTSIRVFEHGRPRRRKASLSSQGTMRQVITPELGDEIAKRREAGETVPAIASELGLNEKTVSGYCTRFAIEPPKPIRLPDTPVKPVEILRNGGVVRLFTVADDRRLMELRETGATFDQIGDALDRRKSSVISRFATLARREARQE